MPIHSSYWDFENTWQAFEAPIDLDVKSRTEYCRIDEKSKHNIITCFFLYMSTYIIAGIQFFLKDFSFILPIFYIQSFYILFALSLIISAAILISSRNVVLFSLLCTKCFMLLVLGYPLQNYLGGGDYSFFRFINGGGSEAFI